MKQASGYIIIINCMDTATFTWSVAPPLSVGA